MPAIQIARLRVQIDQLRASTADPGQFSRLLHELLDFYNDRTYRPGQAGQIPPLLPHYRVPRPVIRQVEIELSNLCRRDPQAGLALADKLWTDSYIEPRMLAIHLLSQIPVSPPDPILERLSAWAQPSEDRQVLDALIRRGTSGLLREQTGQWSALVRDWLTSEDLATQAMGLHALQATVEDEAFQNLPIIFHLISPFTQNPSPEHQGDLLSLLEALVKRSPSETAYFCRQVLVMAPNRLFPRLVRRCLPYFSPEIQANLREALKTRTA